MALSSSVMPSLQSTQTCSDRVDISGCLSRRNLKLSYPSTSFLRQRIIHQARYCHPKAFNEDEEHLFEEAKGSIYSQKTTLTERLVQITLGDRLYA